MNRPPQSHNLYPIKYIQTLKSSLNRLLMILRTKEGFGWRVGPQSSVQLGLNRSAEVSTSRKAVLNDAFREKHFRVSWGLFIKDLHTRNSRAEAHQLGLVS